MYMNQIEKDIIIQGSQENIKSELREKLSGKSSIDGKKITIHLFIHIGLGEDLNLDFIGQINDIIQDYFGGTSIYMKIGEIPFEIEQEYIFKMIVHRFNP